MFYASQWKLGNHFAGAETVWASDGHYSVHVIAGCDMDAANGEDDGNDAEEKLRHISGSLFYSSSGLNSLYPSFEVVGYDAFCKIIVSGAGNLH